MNGLVSALAARKGAGTEAASISSQVLICLPYLRKNKQMQVDFRFIEAFCSAARVSAAHE